MKKFMAMMLGLGLVLGTASVAFGDDAPAKKEKETKKKVKKAKKTAEAEKK
jgi:hypothetical protein